MLSYNLFNKIYCIKCVTPLNTDCGQLCESKCCKSLDSNMESGMLLFPGEEQFLKDVGTFEIVDTEFKLKDKTKIKMLICDGTCDRKFRPIACRIFPLIALISNNSSYALAVDKRAIGTCPLALPEVEDYITDEFYNYVESVYNCLIEDSHCKEFMSILCDEIIKFY